MNSQEILTKAIKKAIAGGWNEHGGMSGNPNAVDYLLRYQEAPDTCTWLFSHDFAKALWGEKEIDVDHLDENYNAIYFWRTEGFDNAWFEGPAWIFHLQQMVIAENQIKYLGEHL